MLIQIFALSLSFHCYVLKETAKQPLNPASQVSQSLMYSIISRLSKLKVAVLVTNLVDAVRTKRKAEASGWVFSNSSYSLMINRKKALWPCLNIKKEPSSKP